MSYNGKKIQRVFNKIALGCVCLTGYAGVASVGSGVSGIFLILFWLFIAFVFFVLGNLLRRLPIILYKQKKKNTIHSINANQPTFNLQQEIEFEYNDDSFIDIVPQKSNLNADENTMNISSKKNVSNRLKFNRMTAFVVFILLSFCGYCYSVLTCFDEGSIIDKVYYYHNRPNSKLFKELLVKAREEKKRTGSDEGYWKLMAVKSDEIEDYMEIIRENDIELNIGRDAERRINEIDSLHLEGAKLMMLREYNEGNYLSAIDYAHKIYRKEPNNQSVINTLYKSYVNLNSEIGVFPSRKMVFNPSNERKRIQLKKWEQCQSWCQASDPSNPENLYYLARFTYPKDSIEARYLYEKACLMDPKYKSMAVPSSHLLFMGLPLTGDLDEFCEKLEKKGLELEGKSTGGDYYPDSYLYKGFFYDESVYITVQKPVEAKNIQRIVVDFSNDIPELQNRLVSDLSEKYGFYAHKKFNAHEEDDEDNDEIFCDQYLWNLPSGSISLVYYTKKDKYLALIYKSDAEMAFKDRSQNDL